MRSGNEVARGGKLAVDELNDFLDIIDSDDEERLPRDEKVRGQGSVASPLPPDIAHLMRGDHRSLLLKMATWLRDAVSGKTENVFIETDFGAIKFEVIDWTDTPGFVRLIVNEERLPFRPRPMATMRIIRNEKNYNVTCVATPMPMIPGLPFSELLLVINQHSNPNNNVEKDAKVRTGITPSVVSGLPSTDIDNEEPVSDGEKSASWRDAASAFDFDIARDD